MSLYVPRTLGTMVLLIGCLWNAALGQGFAGGTGRPEDPYRIGTVDQLMALAQDPNLYDKHFVLVADIDLAGRVHSTAVIAPDLTQFDFVYEGTPFTGTFDGAEHEIANLTIDIGLPANGFDYLGLFGSVGAGAVIKNLALAGVSVQGGTNSDCLGGLAGQVSGATIDNCSVTGLVASGLNAQCVGGLIGPCEDSTISNCHSACTITGDENSGVLGGLLGSLSSGTISGCAASATVRGSILSAAVGGLIGSGSSVTASDCGSESIVSSGIASYSVGGLIGSIHSGTLTNCHSAASVNGDSESFDVGGLIGSGDSVIVTGCYATGPVSGGINSDFLGGLIGLLQGPSVRTRGETKVVDSYSDSSVTGRDNSDHVGGLIGANARQGKIYRSHATGTVHGEEEVGGLVGWNEGAIVECYATGDITSAIDADRLGGLAGRNRGCISGCYATGSITGDFNSDHLGGLVGKNEYLITDCYATGAVSGGLDAEELGGLVGFNDDSGTRIWRCYSTGLVTSQSDTDRIGGLVGYHRNGYIHQCFWDVDSSEMADGIGVLGGQQDEDDATGLTAAQMQDRAVFADWGFADAANTGLDHQWIMAAGDLAPVLWWQRPEVVPLPTFSGGSGTEDDPYLIADLIDLNSIGYNPRLLDKHYQLVADLNLATDQQMRMIGNDLHPFTGTFDGNGHTIDNETHIRTADYETFIGTFGCVDPGGEIRNLTLALELSAENAAYGVVGGLVACAKQAAVADCHVVGIVGGRDYVAGLIGFGDNCRVTNSSTSVSTTGHRYLGGLMGYSRQGDVTGCRSDGSVAGDRYCGGLIGYMNEGTLTYSSNAASVAADWDAIGGLVGHSEFSEVAHSFNTAAVGGKYDIGGIVGEGDSTQIRFAYSTGPISGEHNVGGLAGHLSDSQVLHSYSVGAIIGTNNALTGGLVGGFAGNPSGLVVGCFWDIETSGQTESDGGQGLRTAEMKDINTYLQAGWDFADEPDNGTDEIWIMFFGDYPRLAWEVPN